MRYLSKHLWSKAGQKAGIFCSGLHWLTAGLWWLPCVSVILSENETGLFLPLLTCFTAPVCKQQLDLQLTKNAPSEVEGRSNLLNHTPQTNLLVSALHYRTSSQKPFPKANSDLAACCQRCLHPKSSTAFLKIPSCLPQKDEAQSSFPGSLTGTRWECIPARRQPVKELHFWTASSFP